MLVYSSQPSIYCWWPKVNRAGLPVSPPSDCLPGLLCRLLFNKNHFHVGKAGGAATSTWSRTHCGWFPATPKTKPHNVVDDDDDIALCLAIILPRHDWGSSCEGRSRGSSRGEGETGRLAAKLSKTLLFVLSGRLRGARSQDCLLYIFRSTARVLPLPVGSRPWVFPSPSLARNSS